jgi:hypothetical protein
MGAVTEKRKFLRVEEKVKAIRGIQNWKENADMCREFDLINSKA